MAEMKFEEALEKLNKIVQELESGELDLEQAIKKFEEGNALRKFCEAKLKETERKIEVIIKDKAEPKKFSEDTLPTKEMFDIEDSHHTTKPTNGKNSNDSEDPFSNGSSGSDDIPF